MIKKTRIFERDRANYRSKANLAMAMGLSISQVYRVREGKRGINQKFIIGAKKAFPHRRLDDLFYLEAEPETAAARVTPVPSRYHDIMQKYTAGNAGTL